MERATNRNLTDAKKNVEATTSFEKWPVSVRNINTFSNTSKKAATITAAHSQRPIFFNLEGLCLVILKQTMNSN
jgi:hypothetical protein